jgi:hypothetical protein
MVTYDLGRKTTALLIITLLRNCNDILKNSKKEHLDSDSQTNQQISTQ